MQEDYEVWNIEEMLKAYADIPDMADGVKMTMDSLFLFLENNSLLTCPVSDGNGRIIKTAIWSNELTEEGNRLSDGPKNAVHRWLGSKGSQKIPPDMMILEKALAEIRSE